MGIGLVVFVFILIAAAVFGSFMASKQFENEQQAIDTIREIEKAMEQARKLIESGQYKESRSILEHWMDKITIKGEGSISCTNSIYKRYFNDIKILIREIEQEEMFIQKIENNLGGGIESLAILRAKGIISDQEFDAFSERFKVSTGEKARDIISAISDLHGQYINGALSEGNYRASLWSLLDKLDRKT